jgi:hypothetical protein
MYTSGKRAVSRYLYPYRVRCILFVIVSYRINLRIIRAALIAVAAPGPECHEAWACVPNLWCLFGLLSINHRPNSSRSHDP